MSGEIDDLTVARAKRQQRENMPGIEELFGPVEHALETIVRLHRDAAERHGRAESLRLTCNSVQAAGPKTLARLLTAAIDQLAQR